MSLKLSRLLGMREPDPVVSFSRRVSQIPHYTFGRTLEEMYAYLAALDVTIDDFVGLAQKRAGIEPTRWHRR